MQDQEEESLDGKATVGEDGPRSIVVCYFDVRGRVVTERLVCPSERAKQILEAIAAQGSA